MDVFAITKDDQLAYVNYLKIVNGSLINTDLQEMVMNLDDDPADLLAFAIPAIRERFDSVAPEVIVPIDIIPPDINLVVTVPKIGEKKKLIELAEKNIDYYILQKRRDEISRKDTYHIKKRSQDGSDAHAYRVF